jgi:hypothetical protein
MRARQTLWRLSALDHPMEAHKIDSRAVHSRGGSADAREGVEAYFDKRQGCFPDTMSADMPPWFPWWNDRPYA